VAAHRRLPTAHVRAAALTAVLLAGTACGGDSADARPAGSDWRPASGTAPAPPADAHDGDAGADCSGSTDAVAAALAGASTVTDVQVMGQCTHVSVRTTLAYDQSSRQAADRLCETAAKAAYETGLSSVSVKAADNSEIATGIEGMPCLTPWG
jgi:hypothetical protein